MGSYAIFGIAIIEIIWQSMQQIYWNGSYDSNKVIIRRDWSNGQAIE